MKKRVLIVVGLLILVTLSSIIAIQVTFASSGQLESPRLGNEVTFTESSRILSEEEEKQVTATILDDPRFQALVKDRGYTIQSVALWYAEDGKTRIGGKMIIVFDKPQQIDNEWQYVQYEEQAASSYKTLNLRADFLAGGLCIGVDLERNEVVEITPFSPNL